MKISAAKANSALKAITRQFKVYTEDSNGKPNLPEDMPVLCDRGDHWEIVWESGSPYEWAYLAFQGGVDEEMTSMAQEFGGGVATIPEVKCPKGVYAEPVMSFILGLYED